MRTEEKITIENEKREKDSERWGVARRKVGLGTRKMKRTGCKDSEVNLF